MPRTGAQAAGMAGIRRREVINPTETIASFLHSSPPRSAIYHKQGLRAHNRFIKNSHICSIAHEVFVKLWVMDSFNDLIPVFLNE